MEPEIIRHYIDFSTDVNGFTKSINFVRWGRGEPQIEIRGWSEDYPGYGIRFTQGEVVKTKKALEDALCKFEQKGIMINHFHLDSDFNPGDSYIDDEYGAIHFCKIPSLHEILSSKGKLTKEINLIYWDDILPGTSIELKGLKIDIRHWSFHYDVNEKGERMHRGITLDNNYEIQKTIEVFDNYITNGT